ncbi:hypothetical protein [Endozoicomonas sp. 8E]|uniref:type II toxin-antitoxin system VapC family toxin n=1 Tax=Endozoicomonas sp. 8E TaxID=3035692 RepID=UPI002938E6CE|nr:hypothetical protein [Endozoicomonas sp. 8E]WOG26349.1 hypothetical protein P6910_17495 [Endozoicomonas sp. 8E]
MGIKVLEIPREALFLAGKIYLQYRKNKGKKTSPKKTSPKKISPKKTSPKKTSPLPDFFIGAHALISNFQLITRDNGKFSSYFPSLKQRDNSR